MNAETLRRLDELFRRSPVLLGGPASNDEIEAAERHIGNRFPPDYREFLERYGGATVGSLPIFGFRNAEVMEEDTVTDVTHQFRADGWTTDEWVIISIDLAGNPIGLTATGEVWISDHDAGQEEMVAPTFEAFVLQLLDQIER